MVQSGPHGADGTSHDRRDFGVAQVVPEPQQQHFTLGWREPFDGGVQHFAVDHHVAVFAGFIRHRSLDRGKFE